MPGHSAERGLRASWTRAVRRFLEKLAAVSTREVKAAFSLTRSLRGGIRPGQWSEFIAGLKMPGSSLLATPWKTGHWAVWLLVWFRCPPWRPFPRAI